MKIENIWFGHGLPDIERISFEKDLNGSEVYFVSSEYEGFAFLQGIFLGCIVGPILLYVSFITFYLQIGPVWIFAVTWVMGLTVTLGLCTDRSFALNSRETTIRICYRAFGSYIYWTRQFELDRSMTVIQKQAYSDGKKKKTLRDLFLIGSCYKVFLIRCNCKKSWDDNVLKLLNTQLSDFLAVTKAPNLEQILESSLIPTQALKIAKLSGLILVFSVLILTPIVMFSEAIAFENAIPILKCLAIVGFGLALLSTILLSNRPTF